MTARKHDICTIPDCGKPHEARGFCTNHYNKLRIYGDPLGRATRRYEVVCAIEGCDKPRLALAWCSTHYQRIRRWGDANHAPFSSMKQLERICTVEGCDRPHASRGLCGKHYRRQASTGSVDDVGRPYKGKFTEDGYRSVYVPDHPNAYGDGYVLEHRLVMTVLLDRPLLPNENVHHRNGDRLDNRPDNLELWSTVQPAGQRVEDKVRWARELLAVYGELFPE